jgi:hypothetical protein
MAARDGLRLELDGAVCQLEGQLAEAQAALDKQTTRLVSQVHMRQLSVPYFWVCSVLLPAHSALHGAHSDRTASCCERGVNRANRLGCAVRRECTSRAVPTPLSSAADCMK